MNHVESLIKTHFLKAKWIYIVGAAKTVVFGGFLGVYGKTIGQSNYKLVIYQDGRDL